MIMSRALDPSEPVAAPPAAARSRGDAIAVNSAVAFFREPLAPIFTAMTVLVLVVLGIEFARTAGLVAALWGAGGVAVAVWLRSARGPSYDLCFAGLLATGIAAGELLAGNSYALSALFTAVNMLEIGTAVLLARRFAPTLNLATVDGASRFLLSAAVIAPIPAAAIAAGALHLIDGSSVLHIFQTWWFGHALGIAVIGSFGLSLTRRHLLTLRHPLRAAEAAILLALLVAVCIAVFVESRVQVAFVVIPVLILFAVRFRVLGVATALVIVTLTAVGGAMMGRGPFLSAGPDLADQALLAQLMVLFGCMPILLVAALLEERDRLSERAKAGQVRAERASEAKSRLLANVAHEIKSPVGGVIGIGELWKTGQLGPVTETQAEMAEMLVKTARQVEALSHDLLDMARAESGAVKVELRPTDIPGVLEDVRRATLLRPEAEGVRLHVVSEGDGLIALADSQRLTQVISNLASNAVKYGGSGGLVVFRASKVYDGVRIEVIDRGPGLSPEKQAQLFEPFNRLGLERSTVEGHGIGLALAKRLVELQGGAIGVVSTPGEGAAFWVELPAA
ncbi:MAG: MASE1 domain-containing protein [Alphaproteobacteria bacterium]|nr:MASE1 domain-containing protein [Alphaproteobacteria bacterium]MBU2271504.1 MASE1 domain-containing protein [Alphaproteobacteria bacterium]MBU2418603.1 MASE1 domain-containing protein [Alphaproteobacteria bacterium]